MTADVQRELAEALIEARLIRWREPELAMEYAAALLPTVQALIADAEKRAAAGAVNDLADDFDNGPFYAQATRYFADRDVDADGMDVARIIRAAALDPAGAASGEAGR